MIYHGKEKWRSGLEYLHTVIKYIMTTSEDVTTNELKKLIENNISKEKGGDVMTIAEQLIQEGMQKGRQEGMQEEAKESVLRVLEARFNFVPEDIKGHVESITDIETLEMLHKKAVTITDLNAFSKVLDETDLSKH